MLLDSLERDGDLHPDTDTAVVGDLRRRLINRLEVEAWYAQHPEVEDVAIRGPIDINGLPRTGTTALADMLSLDPQFRCLRGWEQTKPVPPPMVDDEAEDPRRLAFVRIHEERSAEHAALHIFEVDATMEDTEILGMAFHGQQMTLPVAGYRKWWRSADLTDTYEYHRRVVKLLGSKRPPELWLFKAPHHKFHLEALAGRVPRRAVRDDAPRPSQGRPVLHEPGFHDLPARRRQRDLQSLGREVSEHLREGMQRAIEERGRIGEERFLDIHHGELVTDPKGTIRRVYDWLGLELTPAVAKTIFDWQEANAMGAKGTHRYTAEQFGLSIEQIRSDYDFYIRHFDVARGGMTAMTAPAHLGCTDGVAEGRRRPPAGHLASRRRVRGRSPGHEQARAVDPCMRLPVQRVHRRPQAGVHAVVELRLQSGRSEPRLCVSNAEIDGAGVYELVGRRGTVRFVEITQQAPGMMTSLKGVERKMKFNAITHDLDDLTIAEDGSFRVVLSVERPQGHDGDWWQLNPEVGKLLMRKCACDWNTEIDAQVAINRLDDAGEDMAPAEIARRFSEMGDWIKGMIDFDMELVRYYREHHGFNVCFVHSGSSRAAAWPPSRPTTTGSTRSPTTKRSSWSFPCRRTATTGRSWWPMTASRPSTG